MQDFEHIFTDEIPFLTSIKKLLLFLRIENFSFHHHHHHTGKD